MRRRCRLFSSFGNSWALKSINRYIQKTQGKHNREILKNLKLLPKKIQSFDSCLKNINSIIKKQHKKGSYDIYHNLSERIQLLRNGLEDSVERLTKKLDSLIEINNAINSKTKKLQDYIEYEMECINEINALLNTLDKTPQIDRLNIHLRMITEHDNNELNKYVRELDDIANSMKNINSMGDSTFDENKEEDEDKDKDK